MRRRGGPESAGQDKLGPGPESAGQAEPGPGPESVGQAEPGPGPDTPVRGDGLPRGRRLLCRT